MAIDELLIQAFRYMEKVIIPIHASYLQDS